MTSSCQASRRFSYVQCIQEIERLNDERSLCIAFLRAENEESTHLRCSRACGVCRDPTPRERAVFTECGHIICRVCAEKMSETASGSLIVCPICLTASDFIRLMENENQVPSTSSDELHNDQGNRPNFCYSRVCGGCLTLVPRQRAAFTACGHIICLACAVEKSMDACGSEIVCPFCREASEPVPLYEELIEVESQKSKAKRRRRKLFNRIFSRIQKLFF